MQYPAAMLPVPMLSKKVCITTRFGYSFSDEEKVLYREKLMYASSITTIP